jgi:hypothetical protein
MIFRGYAKISCIFLLGLLNLVFSREALPTMRTDFWVLCPSQHAFACRAPPNQVHRDDQRKSNPKPCAKDEEEVLLSPGCEADAETRNKERDEETDDDCGQQRHPLLLECHDFGYHACVDHIHLSSGPNVVLTVF